jgi:hypothetical protein
VQKEIFKTFQVVFDVERRLRSGFVRNVFDFKERLIIDSVAEFNLKLPETKVIRIKRGIN